MKNKYIILLLVTQLFVLIISILFLVNIKQLVTQANLIKITDTQTQVLVKETQTDSTKTNAPKGLIDNLDTYLQKSISSADIPFQFTNSIFTEGIKCTFETMGEMICNPSDVVSNDMYWGGITLLAQDLAYLSEDDSTYYIEYNSEGGPTFKGPFTGNVKNLFKNSLDAGNLIESENFDSFFTFIEN